MQVRFEIREIETTIQADDSVVAHERCRAITLMPSCECEMDADDECNDCGDCLILCRCMPGEG